MTVLNLPVTHVLHYKDEILKSYKTEHAVVIF